MEMESALGMANGIYFISIIEWILRILAYMAVICISYKGVKALNIYINKNSR